MNNDIHISNVIYMTKSQLWKIYTDKNPKFLTEGCSFTAAGLKKFFDTTFDQAHDQGVLNGRALEKMEKKPSSSSDSSPYDIFSEMFKK